MVYWRAKWVSIKKASSTRCLLVVQSPTASSTCVPASYRPPVSLWSYLAFCVENHACRFPIPIVIECLSCIISIFPLATTLAGREVVEVRNDRSVICNGRDTDPDYDPEHDFENDPLDSECDRSVVNNYNKYMHGRKYYFNLFAPPNLRILPVKKSNEFLAYFALRPNRTKFLPNVCHWTMPPSNLLFSNLFFSCST